MNTSTIATCLHFKYYKNYENMIGEQTWVKENINHIRIKKHQEAGLAEVKC